MKRFYPFVAFAVFVVLSLLGGRAIFRTADALPPALASSEKGVDPGACFRLHREGASDAASAPPSALRRGLVHAAFNRPARAESTLVHYLERAGASDDSTDLRQAREALAETYVRMGRYGAAAREYEELLQHFRSGADSVQVADWTDSAEIWAALRDAPPQTIRAVGDSQIPLARDRAGLTTLPVEIAGTELPFVFDTGAGLSVISDSLAGQLGFRIVAESINVGSATGGLQAHLALAPPVRFGRVTVRDAVFLVLPDENLSFPQIDYRIHGIIGFPIITALREITLQGAVMHVPERPRSREAQDAPNLCFEGNMLLTKATFEGVPLTLNFDSGANTTNLFSGFFEAHERLLRERGVPDSVRVGGAAGSEVFRIIRVDDASLNIAGQAIQLPSVAVNVDATGAPEGRFADGRLGQDVIQQLGAITLNFDAMHLRVRTSGEAGGMR